MIPSVSVWPDAEPLANDSSIPLYIALNCFDSSESIPQLNQTKVITCPTCHTPFTKIFEVSKNTYVCPICRSSISQVPPWQKDYKNFYLEYKGGMNFKFTVIFVVDTRGDIEQFLHTLASATIALNSIPQDSKCGFCLLHKQSVSFIKSIGSRAYFIDLPLSLNLFDSFAIDNILISPSEIEVILSAALENYQNTTNPAVEDPINFQNFFDPPAKQYLKLIVFTYTSINANQYPYSIDVIGPNIKPSDSENIFVNDLAQSSSFQIEELVKRLFTEPIYFDAKISPYYIPSISLLPTRIKAKSVRPGTLYFMKVEYHWLSVTLTNIPFVVMMRSLVYVNNEFYLRIKIYSDLYPCSKNNIVLYQSVNPMIVAAAKMQQLPAINKSMLDFYNNKIIPALPGPQRQDQYFELFPNLAWLIRYSRNIDNWTTISPFIVQPELIGSLFFPIVSFWANMQDKIEEFVCEFLFGHPPEFEPIIVIDYFDKIVIFSDVPYDEKSTLAKEIDMRASKRFPVPQISTQERNAAKNYFPLKFVEYSS